MAENEQFADEGNPLENLEEFVNEGETTEDEIVVEEETDVEVEAETEVEEPETAKVAKKAEPSKTASEKEEHAWGKVKKENTVLKAENSKLLTLLEGVESRLANLESSESTRGLDNKKTQYIQTYLDDGFSEGQALRMAERDIKNDKLEIELASIKKQPDSGKSKADIKTQTEQSMLYKLQKGQKVKTELTGTSQVTTVRLTPEQKRVWDMTKKTSWGKDMGIKDFIKQWDE